MIKKIEKTSFRINPNEIALNRRKFETSEIGRGVGTHKTKKGKGSYSRKGKHKRQYSHDDYTALVFYGFFNNSHSHGELYLISELKGD